MDTEDLLVFVYFVFYNQIAGAIFTIFNMTREFLFGHSPATIIKNVLSKFTFLQLVQFKTRPIRLLFIRDKFSFKI